METKDLRMIVWALFVWMFAFVLGCEPEPTSNTKRERLYATENIQLKKELAQLEKRLTKKYEKDMAEKQKLLEECNKQKDFFQEGANEKTDNFMEDVVEDMLNEIASLREENQKLKEQIEKLKSQMNTPAEKEQ